MAITAKLLCNVRKELSGGADRAAEVGFQADYADGRNQEWAVFTPSLSLRMTLKGELADRFEPGKRYTLTIEEDGV